MFVVDKLLVTNAVNRFTENTPLHLATEGGHLEARDGNKIFDWLTHMTHSYNLYGASFKPKKNTGIRTFFHLHFWSHRYNQVIGLTLWTKYINPIYVDKITQDEMHWDAFSWGIFFFIPLKKLPQKLFKVYTKIKGLLSKIIIKSLLKSLFREGFKKK